MREAVQLNYRYTQEGGGERSGSIGLSRRNKDKGANRARRGEEMNTRSGNTTYRSARGAQCDAK